MRRRGFTLVELLVVVGAAGVLAALFVPPWLAARKRDTWCASQRAAYSIRVAEETLYSNDLDGNRTMDYWCRDIRGLTSFRAPGSVVGLIDDRLAAADDAYPDAHDCFGHRFLMVELDEEGRPMADASGFGPCWGFVMYPGPGGEFRDTWLFKDGGPWCYRNGRNPLRRMMPAPAALGWFRACG